MFAENFTQKNKKSAFSNSWSSTKLKTKGIADEQFLASCDELLATVNGLLKKLKLKV
ncbi:hypothetical protein [Vibrio superstes]|uniref:Uncharacterized protein n=1 Tax=Vibrio superstes NBRC 103154 TaxID=1219062 RepID=A0A511QVF4_9VIBR|nr:hypothetical protein [Vibrio superstes]GEM81345.1 hypothetical protein VSU01S_35900 [Vibrio superstes NBRC 103154]